MGKKLTQEEVESYFSSKGATLLSNYVNAHEELIFICSTPGCGKKHRISWMNIKAGDNPKLLCPDCNPRAKKKRYQQKSYNLSFFKKEFSQRGAELLTTGYKNPHSVLEFKCSNCGSMYKIIAWDFIQGMNPKLLCSKCNSYAKAEGERKERVEHNLEEVREEFAKRGALLVSEEYSYTKPLEFICSTPDCDNHDFISYSKFLQGGNPNLLCSKCNPRKKDKDEFYQFLVSLFKSKGAEPLFTEYINNRQELEFICSQPFCTNKYSITCNHLLEGSNPNLLCEHCLKGNMFNPEGEFAGKGHRHLIDNLWLQYIKEFFNISKDADYASHHLKPWGAYPLYRLSLTNGYPLRRELHSAAYSAFGAKNPYHMVALLMQLSNFPEEAKLPYHDYEDFHFIDMDKIVFTDIILTEEESRKLKERKLKAAEEGKLFIPVFFEEMMTQEKREIIYSMIRNRISRFEPSIYDFTGVSHRKYYARDPKVKVVEVNYQDATKFLNKTHIQGSIGGEVYLALTYDDTIISLMVFGKARVGNCQYELLRYSSDLNTIVVGGANKLFKAFLKLKDPKTIVSYCDMRFSSVNPEETMYPKLGFKFKHFSAPNYRYYSEELHRTFSRQMFQKHKLGDLLEVFDPNLSEQENMRLNKYTRLYDCGNMVFEWRKEDVLGSN